MWQRSCRHGKQNQDGQESERITFVRAQFPVPPVRSSLNANHDLTLNFPESAIWSWPANRSMRNCSAWGHAELAEEKKMVVLALLTSTNDAIAMGRDQGSLSIPRLWTVTK